MSGKDNLVALSINKDELDYWIGNILPKVYFIRILNKTISYREILDLRKNPHFQKII